MKEQMIEQINETIVSIVTNIVLEPFLDPLLSQICSCEYKFHFIPYDSYFDNGYKEVLECSKYVVIWNSFEVFWDNQGRKKDDDKIETIDLLSRTMYANIHGMTNAKIIWITYECYYSRTFYLTGSIYSSGINKLNLSLAEFWGEDVTCIDLSFLIARIGANLSYSPKNRIRWNSPYSNILLKEVAIELDKQFRIDNGNTKKCLVLDCDNVLWGGILSEDGIQNIQLGRNNTGRVYLDFQRFVRDLSLRGVILALCSKNDLHDVLSVFREHDEMILQEDDISCFQVNWDDKPQNIKKISDFLNIGIESMVFVDDSPYELSAVKTVYPCITTILFEEKLEYSLFSCFSLKNNADIENILIRKNTYKTNALRENLENSSSSFEEFIEQLHISVDIHEASAMEYSRIAELTQRTNKCTNGKRYTSSDICSHINQKQGSVYAVYVTDCFSSLGLVGCMEVMDNELSLFSLSCRALGRNIEKKMMEYICEHHKILSFQFFTTGKNEFIKDFLGKELLNEML